MATNIPEEIREKLKIIEKEAEFSQKMDPPKKFTVLIGVLLIASAVLGFREKDITQVVFNILLGSFFVAGYFAYKKLQVLHSNAHDIIKYYRDIVENK